MWQDGRQGGNGTEPSAAVLARAAMAQGLDLLAGNSRASALRWLERAHRLVPRDPNVTLALASACLAHDPGRAASLFQVVLDRHDVRQAWLGLASARLRLAGPDAAAEPLGIALSRHAFSADAAGLPETIGCRPGSPGWCALRPDGGLEIHLSPTAARAMTTEGRTIERHHPDRNRTRIQPSSSWPDVSGPPVAASAGTGALNRVRARPGTPGHEEVEGRSPVASQDENTLGGAQVFLDGNPVHGTKLPANWERGRTVDVRIRGVPLLGSPIHVWAIRRLAGCVEVWDGGIRGWAWHPGDPETPPVLTLSGPSGRVGQSFVARDESVAVPDTGPLARPRSFRLPRAELPAAPGPMHILGPDGKDLPGSPLDPFADEAAHVAAALRLGQVYAADRTARTRAATAGGPVGAQVTEGCPDPIPVGARTEPGHGTGARTGLPSIAVDTLLPGPALRADGPIPAQPVGADGRRRAATIVIPVHDGGEVVLACLRSVLASLPAQTRVLVVDDGSSDAALAAALDDLVRARKIALRRHPRALGFPAAANAGILAATGRDVVLLNSDTLVPPGWLERLRQAAYASREIGTVTPLSNDASILSYPGPAGTNPRPDQAATNRLDRLAEQANGGTVADIPVGVGFCLYLRRDCLNSVGSFRADVFAQGYGEENDFCLRARRLGWRNVALTGLFVGHLGGASFGGSAVHLRTRNGRLVEELHPGYAALVENYLARDPLTEPRRRIDLLQWRERGRKWQRSAILITHDDGGGVEQRLIHAANEHDRAGRRPIVLRPTETTGGEPAIAVRDGMTNDLPNLIFAMPRELPALLRLLRAAKPEMTEVHHFADYPPAVYDMVTKLGVPYDVHVHDYAWFCPRVSLVGAHDRYCGEPDLPDCEACIADNGHFLKENIPVAALRARSAALFSAARRVVVPSDDTGTRMRRHFDGLTTTTVAHEDDAAIASTPATRPPAPRPPALPRAAVPSALPRAAAPPALPRAAGPPALPRAAGPPAQRGRASVCVVGAIGVHKGYDILLACARDAVRRDLDLEFIVVGHTIDDARMLATGRVFITGRFEPGEAVGLIAEQNARLGFVASVCPETWCLSLGDIWRAGLNAAAFDIGAPAERIRRTGRGILLPLGLSASAINNTLVAAMATAGH
jgi:GT2 family glycosyltransferase